MTTAQQARPNADRKGSALCLSGGGFRAALFHLGALRRLNEVGLLSRFRTISSVSGGSVASGLLARMWRELTPDPKSGAFTNFSSYEAALREFCGSDIRTGPLLTERLDPRNWQSLSSEDQSATDLLAHVYQDRLVGDLSLKDLDAIETATGVSFVFNTSNLQTGVDLRFGPKGIYDWRLGRAPAPDLLVAAAVAASSAFPIAFPPLVLTRNPNAFAEGALKEAKDPQLNEFRRRLVLTDGGVYDNLGLEPVWKSHQVVLCSDGGKPFALDANPGQALPSRLLRAQDVIGNQALALRKRWLISSYLNGVYQGTYWGIGTEIELYKEHGAGYGQEALDGRVLDRLRAVRTDFDAFSEDEQLVLMNHGWSLTDAALRTWMSGSLPKPIPVGVEPSAKLLHDPRLAAEALRNSDKLRPFGR